MTEDYETASGGSSNTGEEITELVQGFPLTILGRRVVVLMPHLIRELREMVGFHILFLVGKRCGERWAEDIRRSTGLENLELLEFYVYLGKTLGWGMPELVKVDVNEAKGVIRLYESFEAQETRSDSPVCHFLRGQYAGALSVIFGRKILVVETKCEAQGATYCEFQFKPHP